MLGKKYEGEGERKMTLEEIAEKLRSASLQEVNEYFDALVAQHYESSHDVTGTVDFFLQLGSLFANAGSRYLAKAAQGTAKRYMEDC